MTDWKAINERLDLKEKELRQRILNVNGAKRDLDKLVKAGADLKRVLNLLGWAVAPRDFWRRPVRRVKKELENTARQLELAANKAHKVSLDPLCYGSLWLALLGLGSLEKVKPPKDLAPTYIFASMRLYAKNCRDRAKQFGKLLRELPPRQRREMMNCLLVEVWHMTGKYHDAEIARLLTDTCEAVGSKRQFSEEQIKKHRQRYVLAGMRAHRKEYSCQKKGASILLCKKRTTSLP